MEKQIKSYGILITKAKDELLIPIENDYVVSNPKAICQINENNLYVTNETDTLVFLQFTERFKNLAISLGKISFIDVSDPNNLMAHIVRFP